MANNFQVMQQFVTVAMCCFMVSRANPITAPPTTALPTMVGTTQSTYQSYLLIVQEIEMLRAKFTPMVNRFRTDRLLQSDAQAPRMDILGFLTVTNDMPPAFERHDMTEEELLPKHKLFLESYEEVMRSLKTEEILALRTSPESYSVDFTDDYDTSAIQIYRLLHKVSELMSTLNIDDEGSETFEGFEAVPHNSQIHNTRSLYVLQRIDEYIYTALVDFNRLLSLSN
ncbi:uncharacterized protein LOC129273434 isoform X2 [Lytechinus pictus]|uniref:uncharacterized protein LOC129273434 isoform X2 n=1 Tax=Lytechinus pictus TaxID=7653 RepID=UPI0030BA22C0